ncbi:MAG: hypothetical protein K6G49_00900 [Candidatus Saccharibacteria bacterium]|nr:hypothetical protein [Candidatus Saccharibacteria bacterium]
MSNSSTPILRHYQPAELTAIDYVQTFKKILDGTVNSGVFCDLLWKAENTAYCNSPEDYLRYVEYVSEMPHYPTILGYFTKDGEYRSCEIKERDDLDQYFHELLAQWDNLDLPGPEDYLGCGVYYDDVEVLIVDSLNWVA